MKKFLGSVIITVAIATILFSAVQFAFAAYPGPDEKDDVKNGSFGEGVRAWVGGWYDIPNHSYGYAVFSASRWNGTVDWLGYLWFWLWVDDYPIEWYVDGSQFTSGGEVDATFLRTRCLSWFTRPPSYEWGYVADASITAS
jgi:hypothetical protein